MNNIATFSFNLNLSIETNANVPVIVGISIGPPVLSHQAPPVAPVVTQMQRPARIVQQPVEYPTIAVQERPISHITRIVNELNDGMANWREIGEIGNIEGKKETVNWQESGF
jgi:hypothetical protein